jgi:PAS domain S-box-containing protein
MTALELLKLAKKAQKDSSSTLIDAQESDEFAPLAEFINDLIKENRSLKANYENTVGYLREKIDQLLMVIGTIPLRPEELDNETLISLDPIGIIAESFTQILDHLRETNEELEFAMKEIHAIFESVGGGILVLDQEKHILSYNRKFHHMFCTAGENVEGKTCKELICKGNPPKGCAIDEMLSVGQAVSVDNCFRDDRHYTIVASPVQNKSGEIVRGVLLYMDITELVNVKAAMAEEKERLSLTLESIAEGVIATDMQGRVTLMNQIAEKLTGYRQENAIGQPVCEIFNIYEDQNHDSCSHLFSTILREDAEGERIPNMFLASQGGEERLITISAAPIRQQNQKTTGSILVFRDITYDKKIEEEMQKATKIESLGVLAGGIAHDFNNLLTSILGNVSLAKAFSESNENIAKLLADAESASGRAKNLTQQLLTFAKGGAPITSVTSTRKLIIESARFSASGAKIKCDFDIPDNLWQVEVDEGQVGQVIQNLVINADQAMREGGVVQINAENIVIDTGEVPPLRQGKYIRISVTDNGEGIKRKHVHRIFDPYFTTKETGHGLGLAICYSIIKKHQGLITVDSALGVGSTFFVYLPASDKIAEDNTQDEQKPVNGKGKILVMDDEEIVRDVAIKMLCAIGYRVETSIDGKETIELYQKAKSAGDPYDAVIMDLTIPGGMGGRETIEKLREIDPSVNAVVSSGYANDPIMAEYKEHGFSGVIPKPYDMKELGRIVKEVTG